MNDEKDDENPWDEDDAGRTLATVSPSFDSHIPSPVTIPPPVDPPTDKPPPPEPSTTPSAVDPPAVPAPPRVGAAGAVRPMNPSGKSMPKATLVGLNPADFLKAVPRAGSQPRFPAPGGGAAAAAIAVRPANDDEEEDGPTMLGPAARQNELGDSDLPPRQQQQLHDKDAETMAFDIDEDRLPDLAPRDEEIDEATKVGAHARELHRPRNTPIDAGHGAVGDEATLAIPAPTAAVDFMQRPDPSTLGPPLPPQTPPQPAVAQQQPSQGAPQTPRFPSSPHFPPVLSAANALDQTAIADPVPWQSPQHQQPPPPPQQQPWQPPQAPPAWAPQTMPLQPQAIPGYPPHLQQHPPQPWNQAPPNALPAAPRGKLQITPQILLLAAVGVICVAIFITGLVLFFTTKT